MGLFDKMKEPVFLKESSNAIEQLEKLKALEPILNDKGKAKLKQEISYLEYGIAGENNIAFELKNSHIPMYILHDVYLDDGDLNAQIDYLVFTKKICFVIECKNLFGNIEINNMGDFIRTMEFGGKKVKKGIYSPITQNQRHLELMKKLKVDSKTNFVNKLLVGKYFENFYKPIVVLANPKTILNSKFAKKEIKNQVIRADQLVNYIKETCKYSKEAEQSENGMLEWANSFLDVHRETDKDYTSKFEQYLININNDQNEIKSEQKDDSKMIKNITIYETSIVSDTKNIEDTSIFKELKAYRLDKSRKENIKPYYIYNDNQLKDLILKMPITVDSLREVSGFADVKVAKYGDDIIQIIKKHI